MLGLTPVQKFKRFGMFDRVTNEMLQIEGYSKFTSVRSCKTRFVTYCYNNVLRRSVEDIMLRNIKDEPIRLYLEAYNKNLSDKFIFNFYCEVGENEVYFSQFLQINQYGIKITDTNYWFDSVDELIDYLLTTHFEIREFDYVSLA